MGKVGSGWRWAGSARHLYPPRRMRFCLLLAEQMDELLQQCFLHALKCRVKKTDLPLLTSTFLSSHVFSCWYGRHVWVGGGQAQSLPYSLVVGQDRANGALVEGHMVERMDCRVDLVNKVGPKF